MANAKRKIDEENVILKNRGACDFSFQPYQMFRYLNVVCEGNNKTSGTYINVALLKNTIMSDIGVARKFERQELYVEDKEVAKFLGIDSEKRELIKGYEEIKEMLSSAEDKEFENYLNDLMDEDNVSDSLVMIPMIEKVALDVKLSDINKITLFDEYTGRLLGEALEVMREEATLVKTPSKSKGSNKKGKAFE